jgi:hypothetical protein
MEITDCEEWMLKRCDKSSMDITSEGMKITPKICNCQRYKQATIQTLTNIPEVADEKPYLLTKEDIERIYWGFN